MPGSDELNKRREEILRNLSPEEVEKVKDFYNLQDKLSARGFDGGVVVDQHDVEFEPIRILGMGHQAVKPYSLDFIKSEDISKGKLQYTPLKGKPINEISSLSEEHKLHMLDSQYTATWMYSTLMFNNCYNEFIDQINSEHEQYGYFFNIHRENVRLPRIELKVGELYEMRLGKRRDIIKNMVLVRMDKFDSNTLPELYFENESVVGDSSRIVKGTNISHTKVWGKVK